MDGKNEDDSRSIHQLVEPGLPIIGNATGATIGTTIGFIIGGFPGLHLDLQVGRSSLNIFSRAGTEIFKKYLGNRERIKIGAVSFFAMNRIEENFKQNCILRSDDFFQKDSISDRSPADEIFEGVLLAAQKEHEELKIKYLGNLYGNLGFSYYVDRVRQIF